MLDTAAGRKEARKTQAGWIGSAGEQSKKKPEAADLSFLRLTAITFS